MPAEPASHATPVTSARTLEVASPPAIDAASPHLGWPVVLIGLLAVGALVLTRRRRQGHWIKVLETTSLGPKRSLVVAQLGPETVLLATSEAGIVLIKSGLQRAEPEGPARALPTAAGLLDKGLVSGRQFEELLAESAEDQELRQKLAASQTARVS